MRPNFRPLFGYFHSIQVAVNGSTLTERTDLFNQVNYIRDITGAPESDTTQAFLFSYTDNEGKQYQNTLTIPAAIIVTNTAQSSYSLTATLHVGWSSADTVPSTDSLTAYLENTDGSTTVVSQSTSASGAAGEILIDPNALSSASAGSALLSICRSHFGHPAQAPEVGGSITLTRCSPKTPVTLQ